MMIGFPCFDRFTWLTHGFTTRIEGVNISVTSRNKTLASLQKQHQIILKSCGIDSNDLCLPEQVHENKVVIIQTLESILGTLPVRGADGLVTAKPNLALGIHVADCCAVFLVETQRRAIGLLHSGRKGTEAHIVREGVRQLKMVCDGKGPNIVAALSPCIHPCCYEVDFVSKIEHQLREEGVGEIWRHPDCTGCHTDRYYSYRKEKGCTGRMLALMMIRG